MQISKTTPALLRDFRIEVSEVGGIYSLNLLRHKFQPKIFALTYKGHFVQELTKRKTLALAESFKKSVDILNAFDKTFGKSI
jgi:hypothetical protein